MPVVTVFVPPHPSAGELLHDVADAVAGALALGDGDVIAVHVPVAATSVSGAGAPDPAAPDPAAPAGCDGWQRDTWSVVTLHGSARTREKMDAARDAAARAVAQWTARHGLMQGGVWTQWQTPMP